MATSLVEPPLVSIGIPTFNRLSSLQRAVQSARGQDYPNIEIVISDNASKDGTEEFCRSACAEDYRLRYIRQPANVGPERNFATVLQHARGELFMWLADDDWIDANYVSACAGYLSAHADVILAAGTAEYTAHVKSLETRGNIAMISSARPAERVLEFYRNVLDNSVFYGVSRREYLKRLSIRRIMGSDWFMIASLAAWGKVATIASTRLHRSAGGASRDTASMIKFYGLKGWAARQPFSGVAIQAAEEILWRSPAHREVFGLGTRLGLSAKVYATIIGRYANLDRSSSFLGNIWATTHRLAFAIIRAMAPLRTPGKSTGQSY